MLDGGGVDGVMAKTPSRQLVAQWIVGTYATISQEMDKNVWKKWS